MKIYHFFVVWLVGAIAWAGVVVGTLALAVWVTVKILQLTGVL